MPDRFLYEPAGSIHTLMVPPDTEGITDVWFQIYGANLNLDPDGNIDLVTDASTVLRSYMHRCEQQGLPRPNVVMDCPSAGLTHPISEFAGERCRGALYRSRGPDNEHDFWAANVANSLTILAQNVSSAFVSEAKRSL